MNTKKQTTAPKAGAVVNQVNEADALKTVETTPVVEESATVEEAPVVEVEESDLVEIKFLLSPVRKFSLAYNVGETGMFEEKQAAELVEAKYAEYVK